MSKFVWFADGCVFEFAELSISRRTCHGHTENQSVNRVYLFNKQMSDEEEDYMSDKFLAG